MNPIQYITLFSSSLVSQEEQLAAAARSASLPPLQSVMELTSAYKPPTRQFEVETEGAVQGQNSAPEVGRQLEDGTGVLADGTRQVEAYT